ncbi:hypothetical protein [Sphingomonas sp. CFBP 8760]|uniref:hypothetical protein n=1 Tax=Sphingomonas sp. CFBP 8760 TaxID=2775282 RepID=UPI00177FE062|nr:hypothetical protein [Sphingomonas sp. CFBP 8760]MBD8546536.1 hypothetical protein [Sphingomonas sp. CFBP 8760]
MKIIAYLVAASLPTMAEAQVYNTLQGGFTPSDYGNYARGIYPEINSFGRYDSGDTPTMRKQREKRIAAFRAKVAYVLAINNGTLTEDTQKYLRHEFIKLSYRNR